MLLMLPWPERADLRPEPPYVTRERKTPTPAAPQPSAAQFMSNLQTFNIAASQFIKSNSARAKSLGNGFRITRGVTGSS